MSYENTACPCGGIKERETMLCPKCLEHLAGDLDLRIFQDEQSSPETRRPAAIRLLAKARKRTKNPRPRLP